METGMNSKLARSMSFCWPSDSTNFKKVLMSQMMLSGYIIEQLASNKSLEG